MKKEYLARIMFTGFISILLSHSSYAEDTSSLSAIVAEHVAQSFDKGGNLDEPYKALKDALQTNPDSPSLNYQLARYQLKSGSISDDGVIGYAYKTDTAKNALATLEKGIKADPSYGKAYSLAGHIYAIQNQFENAENSFTKAVATKQDITWLTLNQAILHIKMNNLGKAAELLNPIVKTRPPKDNRAKTNVYNSAWSMIKKIVPTNINT